MTNKFRKKPHIGEFIRLLDGLPLAISGNTMHLLFRVWVHTNSDDSNERFGKAWMSHPKLADELHIGKTALKAAFAEAFEWGLLSREHVFKTKLGQTISGHPLTQTSAKENGQYLGSLYWLEYSVMKDWSTALRNGESLSVWPDPNEPTPVPESETPPVSKSERGALPESETPVPGNGTPVAESETPRAGIRHQDVELNVEASGEASVEKKRGSERAPHKTSSTTTADQERQAEKDLAFMAKSFVDVNRPASGKLFPFPMGRLRRRILSAIEKHGIDVMGYAFHHFAQQRIDWEKVTSPWGLFENGLQEYVDEINRPYDEDDDTTDTESEVALDVIAAELLSREAA